MTPNITIEALRDVLREELGRLSSPWLDTDNAAEYLGCTPGTLKTWRSMGKGPKAHVLQDRLIRYHRDDLDAFVRGEVAR